MLQPVCDLSLLSTESLQAWRCSGSCDGVRQRQGRRRVGSRTSASCAKLAGGTGSLPRFPGTPQEVDMGEADQDSLISLENVSKSFGAIQALNQISLRIGRGEVVGLMGDN